MKPEDFIGQHVTVYLHRSDTQAIARGVLEDIDEWGEATLLIAGTRHYVWPVLKIWNEIGTWAL